MAETRYMQDNIQAYVKRLYYAMTDLSKMKDMKGVIGEKGVALGRRVGSPAWRAWAYERRYPRKNIEAKAWQVMVS